MEHNGDYLITATVQFVVRSNTEAKARIFAAHTMVKAIKGDGYRPEFDSVCIEGAEDVTNEISC